MSPARLSGLVGWWEWNKGVTNSSGVSNWADLSGNGNHWIQPTQLQRPTVSGNALSFDGVDDYMGNVNTMSLTAGFDILIRYQGTADSWALTYASGNMQVRLNTNGNAGQLALYWGTAAFSASNIATLGTQFHTAGFSRSNAGTAYAFYDGQTNIGSGATTLATLSLNAMFQSQFTQRGGGLVKSVLIFQRQLLLPERSQMVAYMESLP